MKNLKQLGLGILALSVASVSFAKYPPIRPPASTNTSQAAPAETTTTATPSKDDTEQKVKGKVVIIKD